jgi:urease accessory protein
MTPVEKFLECGGLPPLCLTTEKAGASSRTPNEDSNAHWRAELTLAFARQGERTVLADRKHFGPLVVQRPFYPEGNVCHVYLVHPPGGIAGGDQLRLDATLSQGAHALITTPAATKFYRALPGKKSGLRQVLRCEGATLEWLPQENIVFRDACSSTSTAVHLCSQSKFIGWELTCYGRLAGNEPFDSGLYKQALELWIDGRPTLLDHLRIDGSTATMKSPWGLASKNVLGTLLAYPATPSDLDAARELEGIACTLVDGVLSCRSIGDDSETVKRDFMRLWQALRPRIVGREAVSPRIWAT